MTEVSDPIAEIFQRQAARLELIEMLLWVGWCCVAVMVVCIVLRLMHDSIAARVEATKPPMPMPQWIAYITRPLTREQTKRAARRRKVSG